MNADRSAPSAARSFSLVSGLTLLSRILGLLRDAAMASLFGNGVILDAFTVAFRIPNLARRLFGEGALTAAFLPQFVRERTLRGDRSAWDLGRRVLLAIGVVLGVTVLITEGLLGFGLSREAISPNFRLLLELTAILLPYALLICLVAQIGSMLHAYDRFFWPAALPVLLNVVWMLAIIAVARTDLSPQDQIRVVAVSLTLTGVVQLLLPLPSLFGLGFRFRRGDEPPGTSVRAIGRTLVPILIGLSILQLNTLLDSLIAWACSQPGWFTERPLVEEGTASALYLGQRLYQFPLGVFGVALSTVLFPRFAKEIESGRLADFRASLRFGVQLVLAIGIPASVGLMLLADPVAKLLFFRGAFDLRDLAQTVDCIRAYAAAVWAYCGLLIVSRACYALDDQWTPLRVGWIAVGVNLILNAAFLKPFGGVGLAWASAIAAIVQFVLLLRSLRVHHLNGMPIGDEAQRSLLGVLAKILLATGLMGIAVWGTSVTLPSGAELRFFDRSLAVAGPLIIGLGVFGAAAWLLRIEVLSDFLRRNR